MAHLTVLLQAGRPEIGRAAETVDWPLHVTVLQAFTTGASAEQVTGQVLEILRRSGPLTVTGARTEHFGPAADVPVTVLHPQPELLDLHHRILERLSTGPDFHPDVPAYSGKGYRPHVTACNSGFLRTGEAMKLQWGAVVDMDDRPTVIAATPLTDLDCRTDTMWGQREDWSPRGRGRERRL